MLRTNALFLVILGVAGGCGSSTTTEGGGSGGAVGEDSGASSGVGGASGGNAGSGGSEGQSAGGGGQDAGSCRLQGQGCSASERCCGPLICAGSCSMGVSDRNLKRDIDPVNADEVLESLSKLPISTWSYTTEPSGARHIGPMAQDFMESFRVGSSDRLIYQVDADGVSFAAIQALNRQVKHLAKQNEQLSAELAALRAELHRSKH